MIRFECDYLEGAHQNIIDRMVSTNMMQTGGYGFDPICDSARDRIRKACKKEDLGVYFIVGGTITNLTVISNSLRNHEGCLTVTNGHINVHETGAIEATGHKVITLETDDGKIKASQIEEEMETYLNDESITHVVAPGMVYISQPTEIGTMYSKKELTEIHNVCQKYSLPLYVDGARLGYALASEENDVTLEDLADLTDCFYIGGTKCGALFGEAVVFSNKEMEKYFIFNMKQKGALMAKGRMLGIQFDELFKDNLYVDICRKPVADAIRIRKAFESRNIKMAHDSYTNQQFPCLTKEQVDILSKDFTFTNLGKYDDNLILTRFCTSWATKDENVEKLLSIIKEL